MIDFTCRDCESEIAGTPHWGPATSDGGPDDELPFCDDECYDNYLRTKV